MWIAVPVICTTKKNTAGAINAIVMQEQSGCFKILLVRGKTVFRWLLENCTGSFSCLKVLLIFLCIYLLTKITLRDICHELSKQASEFTLSWFA